MGQLGLLGDFYRDNKYPFSVLLWIVIIALGLRWHAGHARSLATFFFQEIATIAKLPWTEKAINAVMTIALVIFVFITLITNPLDILVSHEETISEWNVTIRILVSAILIVSFGHIVALCVKYCSRLDR